MTEEFISFDPAEALDSKEVIALFMANALASGDESYIAIARDIAARAERIHHRAEKIELPHATLHAVKQAS